VLPRQLIDSHNRARRDRRYYLHEREHTPDSSPGVRTARFGRPDFGRRNTRNCQGCLDPTRNGRYRPRATTKGGYSVTTSREFVTVTLSPLVSAKADTAVARRTPLSLIETFGWDFAR
jgi:hypothetical protein